MNDAINHNPFEAPRSNEDGGEFPDTHPESIRRRYLSHEAAAQSIGTLHFLGAILCGLIAVFLPFEFRNTEAYGWTVLLVFIASLFVIMGIACQRLKPWSRIPSALLGVAVGIMAACIGLPIAAYFLYIMFGANGQMVYSEEYREVIRQTPHIKYKTPVAAWIMLFTLLSLLGAGILLAMNGPFP